MISAEAWNDVQLAESNSDDYHLFQQLCFTNMTVLSDCGSFEYKDCAESFLGRGSFGCVFRGTENSTSKPVAIKKMSKIYVKANELKVMKTVKSSYLVGLIDVCMNSIDDSMYIIMELCDIDLDRHLNYHTVDGILSPYNLRKLTDNIVRGYHALYKCSIVHRDIKPQNILIKYSAYKENLFDAAKISDFGISRILSEEEQASLSNVAGTLYYMAPEVGANILRTSEYSHEVDMWSLGCVFYQCIMGKVPFDERELCRIFLFVACHNYDAYDKPELPVGIDDDIVGIVHSLLEIDSTKRTVPQVLYDEICKLDGSRRCSNDCSYMDDSLSCRSSIAELDDTD
ncbi:unnamed protein product [Thelazia callipaeda]|uniref:Protein kinase domain-containing protein n=1 Tax=Thelazia callipaeda TaxID=103827 RepID=A0A0N5D386_THECL|nr:unnamed protein product [Thelazia callipaeda]